MDDISTSSESSGGATLTAILFIGSSFPYSVARERRTYIRPKTIAWESYLTLESLSVRSFRSIDTPPGAVATVALYTNRPGSDFVIILDESR